MKHPEPPVDRKSFCDTQGNLRFEPLRVSATEIKNALQIFPLSATCGPDGLSTQHLKNHSAEAPDNKLLDSMTQLTKLILVENFPIAITKLFLVFDL